MNSKYTVFVSFTGECCAKPHLWMQIVTAKNSLHAAEKVRREMVKGGEQPCDYVVLDGALNGIVNEFKS